MKTLVARNQTGPKTPAGKIRSSMNALKNFPTGCQSADEAAQLKIFLKRLSSEHYPIGLVEEHCLLQIAMLMIKQMRMWENEANAATYTPLAKESAKQNDAISKQMDVVLKRLTVSQNRRRALMSIDEQRKRQAERFGR